MKNSASHACELIHRPLDLGTARAASCETYQMAAYTQYLCSLKVRKERGCSQSHSLMVSSHEALRNLVRCFAFQLSDTTCHVQSRVATLETVV